jgi:hypothetical protein
MRWIVICQNSFGFLIFAQWVFKMKAIGYVFLCFIAIFVLKGCCDGCGKGPVVITPIGSQ